MPVSKDMVFKCVKCGYMETRKTGDALPDRGMLRPCKKCGGMMMLNGKPKSSFEILKNILPMFHKLV